ncbi:MAG: hypothetical protein J5816_00240 [Clostridia bacterium]|nr:hypothetical protein [Clostridia bacterium]
MQLLVIVLNKIECLEAILERFYEENISGATILDSTGMAHSLSSFDELRFMASLRLLINPDNRESKTIFMVVKEEKIAEISEIVNDITGGLKNPDTGIMFTVPVTYTEGIEKC